MALAYNATNGKMKDSGPAIGNTLGLPVPSRDALNKDIHEYARECHEAWITSNGGIVTHSEGTVIENKILPDLQGDKNFRSIINSDRRIHLGSPSMGGGNVNRYIAYGDLVALPSFLLYCLLSQEGEYNDKMLHEQVHFVGSLSSPGSAHSFLGASYQEALAREFGTHRDSK